MLTGKVIFEMVLNNRRQIPWLMSILITLWIIGGFGEPQIFDQYNKEKEIKSQIQAKLTSINADEVLSVKRENDSDIYQIIYRTKESVEVYVGKIMLKESSKPAFFSYRLAGEGGGISAAVLAIDPQKVPITQKTMQVTQEEPIKDNNVDISTFPLTIKIGYMLCGITILLWIFKWFSWRREEMVTLQEGEDYGLFAETSELEHDNIISLKNKRSIR
jgi:hypothetical protein